MGVPEILKVDEEFREMILRKAKRSEMREHAIAAGTVSLRESALIRVRDGVTNLAEVERVVG